MSRSVLEGGISLVDLCTEHCKIFPSKGELRKLIQGGGVSVNKEKADSTDKTISSADLIADRYMIVQKGKKNYYLITFTE